MGEREKAIATLNDLCERLATEKNGERGDALLVEIRLALPRGHRASLEQLVKRGPVHDGDVISKAHRGDLIRWGLASRVMVKGEWGYTAATYCGGHVLDDRTAGLARSQMRAV